MTRSGPWLASAAVIALTMGVTSRADVPTESDRPLPPGSFVVATGNGVEAGRSEERAQDTGHEPGDDSAKPR
jgi:hypothetical protein